MRATGEERQTPGANAGPWWLRDLKSHLPYKSAPCSCLPLLSRRPVLGIEWAPGQGHRGNSLNMESDSQGVRRRRDRG